MRSLTARVVAALLFGEAMLFFASARWMGSTYLRLGGSWAQAFEAGSGNWEIGGLLLISAALYLYAPDIRIGLRFLAILCGLYGVWTLIHIYSLVGSWNPAHGNMVAISGWSSVGLILIGVAAALDHTASRQRRYS